MFAEHVRLTILQPFFAQNMLNVLVENHGILIGLFMLNTSFAQLGSLKSLNMNFAIRHRVMFSLLTLPIKIL